MVQVFYCEKVDGDEERYKDFFESKIQVQMCGAKNKDIVRVQLQEVSYEYGSYFALKNMVTGDYQYIYKTKRQVEMCSPDGFKRAVAEGEVKIVSINVVEMGIE